MLRINFAKSWSHKPITGLSHDIPVILNPVVMKVPLSCEKPIEQLCSKAVKSIDAIATIDSVQITLFLLLLRQIKQQLPHLHHENVLPPKLTKIVTASHSRAKVTKALASILDCSHKSVEAAKEHIFMPPLALV